MSHAFVPAKPKPVPDLKLPALEYGPISIAIGVIHHVLREAQTVSCIPIGDVKISPRRKEALYELGTNERVIITKKRGVPRPADVDGVLREMPDGSLKWDSNRQLDELKEKVAKQGWPAVASELRKDWRQAFVFKAARAKPAKGDRVEGLRPAQLGALHAIGAHWSLHTSRATIVMPTGTGKTETMLSALAAYLDGPLLVVVPSDALRTQTARKFLTFGLLRQLGVLSGNVPNPVVGIVHRRPKKVADLEVFDSCNVVIATMSALGGGDALQFAADVAKRLDTLMVDEAHHVGAESWAGFREAFKDRKVLQFTATPFRRDGRLVDGEVIYNYPLRMAQADGYFKKIVFEPVYEIDAEGSDLAIAETAVKKLRADLKAGFEHVLMARCSSIARADDVFKIYRKLAPDLKPMIVHSELTDTDDRVEELRSGKSRITVCVDMLGEGFDLSELKIAAVHDLHKSLAVLLQFVGRFTRTGTKKIGDATVIANIANPDVGLALERLYSEDADWNQLLSELSSDAAKEHAELIEFLNSSQRLDDRPKDETTAISHQLLRPTLSTLFFEADGFRPKRFHEGLPSGIDVHRVWLNQASNTLFFVTRAQPTLKWSRSKALRDREWHLFVLHYDHKTKILFLSSSDHSSSFGGLATAVGAKRQISGDAIFRTLGNINRLIFQNVGVKKHGRRNLRYALYTGADVAEALSLSERAGSVKSNLSGTGWEGGRPVTIGCSYKGRVWSREQGPIPRLTKWCEHVGAKVVDAGIDTRKIIDNVLIPEERNTLPDGQVLGLEWPYELLAQAEERVILKRGTEEKPISMFELRFVSSDPAKSTLTFELLEAQSGKWATFLLKVGGDEGFKVTQISDAAVAIKIGALEEATLEGHLSDYPPLVRFVDLSELDGNLLIKPQNTEELSIAADHFEVWDWKGVDITKESILKGNVERPDSIQAYAAKHYIDGDFDIVFNDDSAGEAADLVCLKEEKDHIRLALVHCKFSGDVAAGARVDDIVEVSSQAVRSAKWKWKFRDLCRHIANRERRFSNAGGPSRFLSGKPNDLNRILKASRFKEVRPEILVVQPGLSQAKLSKEQSAVLAAGMAYLKQTIGVDLEIICSA